MKITTTLFTAVLVASSGIATNSAFAAAFTMLNDPSLSTGFEQRWNQAAIWQYDGGVDDGTAGIPDGNDTFTINRNTGGFPANNTDLSNEGMPNPHSVAGITGTGAPGRDLVLKTADTTIGDLTILASTSTFEIFEERDKNLTINGLISGAGNLVLTRNGGFTPSVDPDELITITGTLANTITGTIRLFNSNGTQPGYWVADKVGAFGLTSDLTLDTNGGAASLRLTTNTIGGGGAIDDTATVVNIGSGAFFDVDANVNELIGSGNLFVLGGVIADGTYNNSESWITGDGTITVGVIPEPSSFALVALGLLGALVRRKR